MKTAAHGGVFFDLGLWPTTGAGMGGHRWKDHCWLQRRILIG